MTELRSALYQAHRKAARRDNASTQVLIGAYQSNGHQLIPAITAAMATIGGLHAPIKLTYEWLRKILKEKDDSCFEIRYREIDRKLPGFGSSFHKDGIDPILYDVANYISYNPDYNGCKDISEVAIYGIRYFTSKGKSLFPNLAFYTAAVAIIEGIPIELCESLVIEPRVSEWIQILNEQNK